MGKRICLALLGLAGMLVLALVYGSHRWQAASDALDATLAAEQVPVETKIYRVSELIGLPPPVQRYFRAALTDGQPIIAAVRVAHTGSFNMQVTGDQWKPFSSTQQVITRRPGFVWEARIVLLLGLPVRVHDAYIAGEGVLHASMFGLVTVADVRGTPAMAQGELLRFFAEAAWYPTALLPSQGVQWAAVDDRSARATMHDGGTTVTLLFRFNSAGLIDTVHADSRGALIDGVMVPTPWEGRWNRYELRDGMHIPLEGEVMWMSPGGPRAYWRGQITRIAYTFAR